MSWLSDLLGFTDSSADKKAAKQAAADKQAQRDEEAQAREDWRKSLARAATQGQSSAERYFSNLGLDPSQYSGDIASAIASTRTGIPKYGDIGGAFTGIGQQVYGDLTDALRSRSLSGVNALQAPEVANTSDDALIEQILNEQRGGAEDFATNLLKRGVITDTGYGAATADIGRQAETARGLLGELGSTILGGERSTLENILNQGKQTASTLNLGQSFDPSKIGTNLQSEFDQFMANLPSQFRAQAPTQLFNTAGLANIAGQAQGPQNLAFKPGVVGGYAPEEDQTEENRAATTVF
jgi:hypothetical protein